MKPVRILLMALAAALFAGAAGAQEKIDRFDVTIEVEKDGDVIVTELINVTAEGVQIRRGIFRDLPRYYDSDGARLAYGYHVLGVTRDGRAERYSTATEDAAYRILIGDEDVFLSSGEHAYEIRYRVDNQVRYFADYDEVYWNATGTYWTFPILEASATLVLPPGGRVRAARAYTGALGAAGADYAYVSGGDRHAFTTTRRLEAGEGLTIAVGFDKGLIDPPSGVDNGWIWWQRNGSLAILIASLAALSWFYVRSFDRVGQDPARTPVFPLYGPPEGCSPAAVHHIYYRGLRGHRALIATLLNLAVKGRIRIAPLGKKGTELTLTTDAGEAPGLAAEDSALERSVFRYGARKLLDGQEDTDFAAAYAAFRSALSRKYGSDYFKWNAAYTIAGLALSAGGLVLAVAQASMWTGWHTAGVLGLAGLNLLFLYLMPAPTPKGQKVRTAVEGFRLYMETAEKLQLNAVEVGSEAPPPMSKQRYETFLPYAVALGVEKPWTRHFERLLPSEAEAYSPGWAGFTTSGGHSLSGLSASLISSMSSGVSSALPQSSGASGSGGGGSSGGGGGGGGGGGW